MLCKFKLNQKQMPALSTGLEWNIQHKTFGIMQDQRGFTHKTCFRY